MNEETTIYFAEDVAAPMTIDAAAPGDVIELSDEFDFDGYQVVRREFFAHTFEPSITFNNYKVYVNTACLNKFPHAECVQLLINQDLAFLHCDLALSQSGMRLHGAVPPVESEDHGRSLVSSFLQSSLN